MCAVQLELFPDDINLIISQQSECIQKQRDSQAKINRKLFATIKDLKESIEFLEDEFRDFVIEVHQMNTKHLPK